MGETERFEVVFKLCRRRWNHRFRGRRDPHRRLRRLRRRLPCHHDRWRPPAVVHVNSCTYATLRFIFPLNSSSSSLRLLPSLNSLDSRNHEPVRACESCLDRHCSMLRGGVSCAVLLCPLLIACRLHGGHYQVSTCKCCEAQVVPLLHGTRVARLYPESCNIILVL